MRATVHKEPAKRPAKPLLSLVQVVKALGIETAQVDMISKIEKNRPGWKYGRIGFPFSVFDVNYMIAGIFFDDRAFHFHKANQVCRIGRLPRSLCGPIQEREMHWVVIPEPHVLFMLESLMDLSMQFSIVKNSEPVKSVAWSERCGITIETVGGEERSLVIPTSTGNDSEADLRIFDTLIDSMNKIGDLFAELYEEPLQLTKLMDVNDGGRNA